MALWLTEKQTDGYYVQWRLRRILHEEQTPYQHLQIVEMEDFGRALILDGVVQTTVGDEFAYHEMLVHVPLLTHPDPRRVLIIGGGDGGAVREVLRHPSVEQVDLVEIDGQVVECCKRYLPELAGALDDPRCRVLIADGLQYIRQVEPGYYNVVLVDSSDPVGPAEGLFQRPFYTDLHRALGPCGLFAAQTGSPFFQLDLLREVKSILEPMFGFVSPYLFAVPTYPSGYFTFTLASKQAHPLHDVRTPQFPTRWYTPEVHRAAFALPAFMREALGLAGAPDCAESLEGGRLNP